MSISTPRLEIRSPTPASKFQFFTLPGIHNSGPEHWQTLWEQDDPSIVRIEQRDWDRPDAAEWSQEIETAVRSVTKRVILVAHSCGATAVAHWAQRFTPDIAGAFLVAPPDCERADIEQGVRDFGPVPLDKMPFPSMVVASEDDPYCDFEKARDFANSWGASFVSVGSSGPINAAVGNG